MTQATEPKPEVKTWTRIEFRGYVLKEPETRFTSKQGKKFTTLLVKSGGYSVPDASSPSGWKEEKPSTLWNALAYDLISAGIETSDIVKGSMVDISGYITTDTEYSRQGKPYRKDKLIIESISKVENES